MGCSYKRHFSSDIRNFINHVTYYSLMFFIAYMLLKDKCMCLQDKFKL